MFKSIQLTIVAMLLSLASLAGAQVNLAKLSTVQAPFGPLVVEKLIVMPDNAGHTDWVDAIKSANKSIHMMMYHLTDPAVIDALAAKRNIDVQIIVDASGMKGGYAKAMQPLIDAGIQVVTASKAFSIMHAKAMVIDDATAFVTAINMTNTAQNTRDFGIITADKGVIQEFNSVFATDLANAKSGAGATPTLSNENLAWSPVNSQAKIIQLIDWASKSLIVEGESLSFPDVLSALGRAASRGVQVNLIVPMCDEGNPLFDYPALATLKGLGVYPRVMPYPASFTQPYMHSKMIVADAEVVYVGSINYSSNSLQLARELGILFTEANIGAQLTTQFITDWNRSVTPQDNPPKTICEKAKYSESN